MIFAVLDAQSDCDIRAFLGEMMSDVAEKHFEDWHYVGQRVIHGANGKWRWTVTLRATISRRPTPNNCSRTYTNVMAYEAYGPHMLVGYASRT